jgi:tetratricopeptide (TPR) repeat protein
MKRNVLYALLLLATFGCHANKGESSKSDRDEYIPPESVRLDSIPLTAAQYKELGNRENDSVRLFKALVSYTKAILVDSCYMPAYFNRGNVCYKLYDFETAFHDYGKVMELDSQFVAAYINRGALRARNQDYEGEVADYRLGLKNCPPDSILYNNLGHALYDLGRFKEAAKVYEEGTRHFPYDTKLYFGCGLARLQMGDREGALESWKKSFHLGSFRAYKGLATEFTGNRDK